MQPPPPRFNWSAEGATTRQAVNEWIRTSKAHDGVIDFDEVMRDPEQPTKFLSQSDSGDHLHPGDAGYKAIAKTIDIELFKAVERVTAVTRC